MHVRADVCDSLVVFATWPPASELKCSERLHAHNHYAISLDAMTASNAVSPPEEDLKDALKTLRTENPTLGISKIHAALLAAHPEWAVSEKRTRKVLQSEGLVISSGNTSDSAGFKFPASKVIEGLDVGKWTNKVEVRMFDRKKGKGLVAKERIGEGETIWKEDPFVLAPEW